MYFIEKIDSGNHSFWAPVRVDFQSTRPRGWQILDLVIIVPPAPESQKPSKLSSFGRSDEILPVTTVLRYSPQSSFKSSLRHRGTLRTFLRS